MKVLIRWRTALRCTLLTLLCCSSVVRAEVTLDGTVGPAGAIAGPNYGIAHTVGTSVDTNLFHSFGRFNINSGERATFTGPGAIDNVIARVTGGSASRIDGQLRSTIPTANLWFVNPAGVLFGNNASLNVDGSVHISTADALVLGDGGRYDVTTPANSALTSAPPEAFGFLGDSPAKIEIVGAQLEVKPGSTLSMVGGDIDIVNGQLIASSGRINVAAVASPGMVSPSADDLAITSASQGEVNLVGGGGLIDSSGAGGGAVYIRAGQFAVDRASLFADTYGTGHSVGVSIRADAVELKNGAFITADVFGAGDGGSLDIHAASLMVRDGSTLRTQVESSGNGGNVTVDAVTLDVINGGAIFSQTFTSGWAGDVAVTAESIRLDGGTISSATAGTGRAGDIAVGAESVDLDGSMIGNFTLGSGRAGDTAVIAESIHLTSHAAIQSATDFFTTGDAGDIYVQADLIEVRAGAEIRSSTQWDGHGGSVTIEAGRLLLSRDGASGFTGVAAQSLDFATGDGGDIVIIADDLEIRGGAKVSAGAFGAGDAGSVDIDTGRLFMSTDNNPFAQTQISAQANEGSLGSAGRVDITAEQIELRNGALISASTFSPAGDAGNLTINAESILMSGDGGDALGYKTGFTVQTNEGTGNGGDLIVNTGSLEIRNGADIAASTFAQGDGGDIVVSADSIFISRDEATVFTGIGVQVGFGATGNGGSIFVTADDITIRQGGEIGALTIGAGHGGMINVSADSIFLSGDGADVATGIDAQTALGTGDAGALNVHARQIEIHHGATISAGSFGSGNGGDIRVTAESLYAFGDGALHLTGIAALAEGEGNAGRVAVSSSHLELAYDAVVTSGTTNSGAGGGVQVSAHELILRDGGNINALAEGSGRAGNIGVTADTITMSGQGETAFSGIIAQTVTGPGDAGDVRVNARQIDIRKGAVITASTGGSGHGGNVFVTADALNISSVGGAVSSGIAADAYGSGDAGNLFVEAGTLDIRNGGVLSTGTLGAGNGGSISIRAGSLTLSHDDVASQGAVIAAIAFEESTGAAGDITGVANEISLLNDSSINAQTLGSGAGGDITLRSESLRLARGGTIISASEGAGRAGDIHIDAGRIFDSDSGLVSTEALLSDGGNITINATDRVFLRDSTITTSVGSGVGAGGNISIDPQFIILLNSQIIANAFGGPGGNIHLVAEHFLKDPGSVVTASSALGIDGSVSIDSPDSDVSGSLTILPGAFIDVSSLFRAQCGATRSGAASTLLARHANTGAEDPTGYLSGVMEVNVAPEQFGTLGDAPQSVLTGRGSFAMCNSGG